MKKTFIFIVSWIVIALYTPTHAQQLMINEFMASNAITILDDDGEDSDWIELYNPNTSALDLGGLGLSDDATEPLKWVFPSMTIQAGEYLLVWASGKDRRTPGLPLHTNFSISADGEDLLLSNSTGQQIDLIQGVSLQTDISYGRALDQPGVWKYFTIPSPGAENSSSGYSILLDKPEFSASGGYYADSVQLSIESSIEGVVVYYTTDGSLPDQNDAVFTDVLWLKSRVGEPNIISMIPTNNNDDPGPPYYEGWQPPLGEVYKAHVIRARAFHPDAPPSPVSTHTYIIDDLLSSRYTLPVLSLSTNPENLFDDEIGIYVHGNNTNYFQDGDEWERKAHLSLFEKDGSLAMSEDIGIRTHGNTTRSRPRKSLRMISRAEYGNSWFNYPIFPDKTTSQYKRFILRNSGNDWDWAIFRDAFLQSLAKNLDVDRQYYRPAILFINGEYWGIHNIRDRYDEHYINARYGLEEHEMTMLENNASFKFGNEAGREHYVSMINYMNSYNLANQQYFDEVAKRMDIESFTDFQLTNIFSMNTDWPGNNTLMWRYLTDQFDPNALNGRDGRWRWMLLDLDFGFGLPFFYVPGVDQGPAHNTLAFALATNGPSWPNPPWSTAILRNLLKNQSYMYFFINRFCDLLNTDFSESTVIESIDSIRNILQPEMEEHILRWRRPVTIYDWFQNVENMRSFAQERPGYIRQHLNSYFQLNGSATLKLTIEGQAMGNIQVNTIVIPDTDQWTGKYFKNIPLKLMAMSKPGYRFVRWEGTFNSNSEHLDIVLTTDADITAIFEPSDDFPGDELNPPAYRLTNGPYYFSYWDANQAEGIFPPNMIFQQSSKNDPLLNDTMTHPYHIPTGEYHSDDAASIGFPYRLTRRTRLNGLGENGISFINTGRGRDLGAAVLAIDTRTLEDITVSWKGSTIIPNSRVYRLQLQYRTDLTGSFTDVFDNDGNPIEYIRNPTAGHSVNFEPVVLPMEADNQAYLQLRWKYYFTGQQIDENEGSRDMLGLDNIVVSTVTMGVPVHDQNTVKLGQNYPNPATLSTTIEFSLAIAGRVKLVIFTVQGVLMKTMDITQSNEKAFSVEFDVSDWPNGLYFYALKTNHGTIVKKMMVLH